MDLWPFSLEKNAWDHVVERWKSFTAFDKIRAMQLLEILQYGFGYLIMSFIVGAGLDLLFPNYNEETPFWPLLTEIMGQCLLLILAVFYLRKFVKIMPFMFIVDGDQKYKPYQLPEYSGEMTIAVVLVGTQFNLIKKIDLLSRRIFAYLYGEEKKIAHSIGL